MSSEYYKLFYLCKSLHGITLTLYTLPTTSASCQISFSKDYICMVFGFSKLKIVKKNICILPSSPENIA